VHSSTSTPVRRRGLHVGLSPSRSLADITSRAEGRLRERPGRTS
jgi:hypothetical protein